MEGVRETDGHGAAEGHVGHKASRLWRNSLLDRTRRSRVCSTRTKRTFCTWKLASYYPEHVGVDCFQCRIREGLAGPQEPALLTSAGRMPERSQHRVSGGLDGRSERPAMGSGQPRTAANS